MISTDQPESNKVPNPRTSVRGVIPVINEDDLLSSVLRKNLLLTGVIGCEEGQCRACNVILNTKQEHYKDEGDTG